MPDSSSPAEQEVQQALAACGGDRDAALLLLAHLFCNARRAICGGFLRLGQPAESTTRRT
ncbi:hypothetical protein [Azospirillum lipoferum]|uniref:Uncharacterized protein n=1 Tax=Azospirillum lipoferum (strain 4B) TaxID=862719 RepID=G7Z5G4_AZOL4|nr:hypothetical protein [Azospirillum lipoferum]CBS87023.1 protein of unknown function [Azospirillum lipoferum 4B]